MAQPVWVTDAGNLGTIPEGEFYQLALGAVDPASSIVTYQHISGNLPEGMRVRDNGILEGIPNINVQGVPAEVAEDTISKFAVRATSSNSLNDRTFTITVTGQDEPAFITPAGLLGCFFDGKLVNIQILFEDPDPGQTLTMELVNGEIPDGVTLLEDGLLFGYAKPTVTLSTTAIAGFDNTGTEWDEFPWDFSTISISKNYEFTLGLSDGTTTVLRTFAIYIASRDSASTDTTELTADLGCTIDATKEREPVIETYISPGDLGRYKHDNFFAYQFIGTDFDGDQIRYTLESGTFPNGLILDPVTGWLYGYIPNIGLSEIEYNFVIKVAKTNDPTVFTLYSYKTTFEGAINVNIAWSDADLGTIDTGEISTLFVQSINIEDPTTVLQYRLKTGGICNKLPQGLSLLLSGNIAGRVSYQTFTIDSGTTTFDSEATTSDKKFTFTVEAFNSDASISVFQTFTVTVVETTTEPVYSLELIALAPEEDRVLANEILLNQNIFDPDILYRTDDINFGVATTIAFENLFGLDPLTLDNYIQSLDKNHYRKKLILGELKTARALDDDNNVLYEVVYSQVVDDLVNNDNVSTSKNLKLPFLVLDGSIQTDTVYPTSIENMREQVLNEIEQISTILPAWMLSRQEDGSILGFTPAWVLAYTLPGKSEFLAYSINQNFTRFNEIDFIIDRYVINRKSARHWDALRQRWNNDTGVSADHALITADTIEFGADGNAVFTTADSTTITSDTTLDTTDENIVFVGQTTFDRNPTTTDDNQVTADTILYTADSFNVSDETTFDENCLRFIPNIDTFGEADDFDKYLLFPDRRIIDNVQ